MVWNPVQCDECRKYRCECEIEDSEFPYIAEDVYEEEEDDFQELDFN